MAGLFPCLEFFHVCYDFRMEQEILKRLEMQEAMIQSKVEMIYQSVEKTRKYMMWTGIITIAMIVLPAIGLLFAIPSFIGQINTEANIVQ